MSFHEDLFPVDIALNSEGGPMRKTDIVALASGHEERNSPWAGSRRTFNAGYGVKSLADMEAVVAFFEARRGQLYGFRFRDPFDHKSCALGETPSADDQVIGAGDGVETVFSLTKTYESGGATYVRRIAKPVVGTVLVSVDGAAVSSVAIDETSGTLTFDAPPPQGAVIAAGYVFDTPVRFDTDSLRINLAAYKAGDIPSIPLIEVLV